MAVRGANDARTSARGCNRRACDVVSDPLRGRIPSLLARIRPGRGDVTRWVEPLHDRRRAVRRAGDWRGRPARGGSLAHDPAAAVCRDRRMCDRRRQPGVRQPPAVRERIFAATAGRRLQGSRDGHAHVYRAAAVDSGRRCGATTPLVRGQRHDLGHCLHPQPRPVCRRGRLRAVEDLSQRELRARVAEQCRAGPPRPGVRRQDVRAARGRTDRHVRLLVRAAGADVRGLAVCRRPGGLGSRVEPRAITRDRGPDGRARGRGRDTVVCGSCGAGDKRVDPDIARGSHRRQSVRRRRQSDRLRRHRRRQLCGGMGDQRALGERGRPRARSDVPRAGGLLTFLGARPECVSTVPDGRIAWGDVAPRVVAALESAEGLARAARRLGARGGGQLADYLPARGRLSSRASRHARPSGVRHRTQRTVVDCHRRRRGGAADARDPVARLAIPAVLRRSPAFPAIARHAAAGGRLHRLRGRRLSIVRRYHVPECRLGAIPSHRRHDDGCQWLRHRRHAVRLRVPGVPRSRSRSPMECRDARRFCPVAGRNVGVRLENGARRRDDCAGDRWQCRWRGLRDRALPHAAADGWPCSGSRA